MKTFLKSTFKSVILSSILVSSVLAMPLTATESVTDKLKDWTHSYPWVGMISDEVHYGPITIKDVNLGGDGRLVFAKPGEKVEVKLKYEIDANQLDSWNIHHVIVGLKNQEAQCCISHSLGVWDKKGKKTFTLEAPMEKGLYELRFDYQDAVLCSDAKSAWRNDQPSSRATIGVIIVE